MGNSLAREANHCLFRATRDKFDAYGNRRDAARTSERADSILGHEWPLICFAIGFGLG